MGRTNPKLIIDNTDFRLHNNMGGTTYWRCSFYFRTKCKCRVKTSGNVVYVINSHNHDSAKLAVGHLKRKCVRIVRVLDLKTFEPL